MMRRTFLKVMLAGAFSASQALSLCSSLATPKREPVPEIVDVNDDPRYAYIKAAAEALGRSMDKAAIQALRA